MKQAINDQAQLGNRRLPLRRVASIGVFCSLFLLVNISTLLAQSNEASRPNIVFVLADDLGYNDCSFGGESRYETPNLSRLAREGTILRSLYVQPVCTPTRAALMTGRYPMRYGLQVGVIRPNFDYGLDRSERTLAQELHDLGYRTSIIGKWHLGWKEEWMLPLSRGFDSQYGMLRTGAIDHYTHEREGAGVDWFRQHEPLDEPGYATDLITAEAIKQVNAHDFNQPLFLYVAFNSPHSPYQPPLTDDEGVPANLPEARRDFARMVRAVDRGFGQIIEALQARGVMENTIVVFSSDNGGVSPQRADNRPLRGGKGTLFEGGVRSNGFVWFPGKVPSRQIELPMHTVDWYPTLVQAAGGEVQKANLDGIDQWGRLTGESPAEDAERIILLNAAPAGSALRQGDWKVLRQRPAQGPETTVLYNLVQDLGETKDVAAENPEVFGRLAEALDKFESEQATPLNQQE